MTREERMNRRREAGKGYTYKPNPYPKNTREYIEERNIRASKNVSHKLPTAKMTSIMAKLKNFLTEEEAKIKKRHDLKNLDVEL